MFIFSYFNTITYRKQSNITFFFGRKQKSIKCYIFFPLLLLNYLSFVSHCTKYSISFTPFLNLRKTKILDFLRYLEHSLSRTSSPFPWRFQIADVDYIYEQRWVVCSNQPATVSVFVKWVEVLGSIGLPFPSCFVIRECQVKENPERKKWHEQKIE